MLLFPFVYVLVASLICGVGANWLLPNEISSVVIYWTSAIAIALGVINFILSNVINDGSGNESSIISFVLCTVPAGIQILTSLLSIAAVQIFKSELMRAMYVCELGILIPTLVPLFLYIYVVLKDAIRR